MIRIQRSISDAGGLGVLSLSELPFNVKRIYWLFGTPESSLRGLHAHKTLKQFIFCLAGGFQIELNDGERIFNLSMTPESPGVLIEKTTWRVLSRFEVHTVALVLASEEYDPDDYIHDFQEFLRVVELP